MTQTLTRIQNPDNTDLEDLFCTAVLWLTVNRMRRDPPRRWYFGTRYGLLGKN